MMVGGGDGAAFPVAKGPSGEGWGTLPSFFEETLDSVVWYGP